MRIDPINMLMFATSMLVAAIFLTQPSVSPETAGLFILAFGVMFLLLGVRTNGPIHHDSPFDPER